jgi:hypothetical protein
MKAYIDNNILIDCEENKIELPTNHVQYFYSYVHLQELIELGDRFDGLKNTRLGTIKNLTRNHFIMNDEKGLQRYIISPDEMLTFCMNPISMIINELQKNHCRSFITNYNRDALINELSVDVRRLNNYSADEIAEQFGSLINYYIRNTTYTRQDEFFSFFNILDLIGFWRDKLTEKSNLARAYDAKHAYHASICDYFVTNDIRTMHKSNVVYQTFGYKTIAISYKDYIALAFRGGEK